MIPLTLRFFAQKRNLLIPLELSRVMHQGTGEPLQKLDHFHHLRIFRDDGRVFCRSGSPDACFRHRLVVEVSPVSAGHGEFLRVTPEPFQIIVLAARGREDVNDEVDVVHENPFSARIPFDVGRLS